MTDDADIGALLVERARLIARIERLRAAYKNASDGLSMEYGWTTRGDDSDYGDDLLEPGDISEELNPDPAYAGTLARTQE